jgi:hypothetical protein
MNHLELRLLNLEIWNKNGEAIVQAYPDEYGNGLVYADNRKG